MAEERVQRRLAAILAADAVGYSRLMGDDEEGTLAALTAHLTELVEPCIAEHRGRVVKTTGDGVLAEFASVVDAVRCAVAFQDGMAERNSDTPSDRRIEFRIGVNLGDVIVQDNDVYGDGVNIAARLEGLAEAGTVVVSGSVHEQVVAKIDASFDDLGPRQVKNIGEPVRAFRVRSSVEAAAQPERDRAPPLPDKPSIAVLPLDNISNDPDQEFFSDGITEDIITELSKISGLFVIARHSVFTYKGKSVTLKQVGRDLGVRYVLEGSVRKAGDRLRISAQLIDAHTDHHLWAERYDRDIADIFAVQEEVARHVAEALTVTLKPAERDRLAHAPTENLEAYELYKRARPRTWPPTQGNILSARNAYARVVEVDGTYAGGYAGKSMTHSLAVLFGHSEDPDGEAKIAMDLANRAIAIDPEFARSYSALGSALSALGRHEEAIVASRTAIELQPGDADSHEIHGRCLMFAGAGAEACDEIRTALRLDPQYVEGPYLNFLGRASFIASKYDDTIAAFEHNMARGGPLSPPTAPARAVAACALIGRMDDARRILNDHVLRFDPNLTLKNLKDKILARINIGNEIERLVDGLRKAGLPE